MNKLNLIRQKIVKVNNINFKRKIKINKNINHTILQKDKNTNKKH